MSTGWSGLSKPMVNPISGEKLDPARQWINRWIGENRNWDKDMERVMKMDDGQMMRDLRKLGGKRALLDLVTPSTPCLTCIRKNISMMLGQLTSIHTLRSSIKADVSSAKTTNIPR